MAVKNPMGANSFDKLENAGILGAKQLTDDQINANLDIRVDKLKGLLATLAKVEIATTDLHKFSTTGLLKQLTAVLNTVKVLVTSKGLPAGSKSHLVALVNELTSLREGAFLDLAFTKDSLTIGYLSKAQIAIANLIDVSILRKEKLSSDSSNPYASSEFYRLAEDVINRNREATDKLVIDATQPFIIARLPVVPADSFISVDKLKKTGILCDSISGYAVINDQILLGISRKLLAPNLTVKDEAERLRKALQKETKTKLNFVSPKAYAFKGRAWFWLMHDKDLDLLATACTGSQVNIQSWGICSD